MLEDLTHLEEIIRSATIELIDYGGTTPIDTFDSLAGDYPDLIGSLEKRDVLALCKKIQTSELPEKSQQLQELFQTFNVRYFGGRLPHYVVRVVIDVNYWINEHRFNGVLLDQFSSGYIDEANKKIFLRLGADSLEGMLLHEMAHAATTGDHDDQWFAEIRRLDGLGAPVLQAELKGYEYPTQLKLDLYQVFDAERIFGEY